MTAEAMPAPGAVKVQVYRGYRLEIRDDGGQGWTIHIHTPRGGRPGTIRNRMPSGLAVLLDEARARVDRECGHGSRRVGKGGAP